MGGGGLGASWLGSLCLGLPSSVDDSVPMVRGKVGKRNPLALLFQERLLLSDVLQEE